MNTVLLRPTDVLFFRDGRPMQGSLAGHGAAWPLPNAIDAAFHAALYRSGLGGHKHDQRHGSERVLKDVRQFGSLVTAGPFPVHQPVGKSPTWYFQRPLDLLEANLRISLLPTARFDSILSSLPAPLEYAVANRHTPGKDSAGKTWLSASAYQRYLDSGNSELSISEALGDSAFSDLESTVGIGIDAETQAQDQNNFYSANFLRLRDEWRLGVLAKTSEKNGATGARLDMVPRLIDDRRQLLVGGQQRLCTAVLEKDAPIALPKGKRANFSTANGKYLVKWILLSPAIWPQIADVAKDGRPMRAHSGGWLPNWVSKSDGTVLLRTGERQARVYVSKHTRGFLAGSSGIAARLVAALVPKPIVVTGWAFPNGADREEGGAKSTHLAVSAGAVYYFEADSIKDATNLATVLNWHGITDGTEVRNRRSTLMGEKGFGLGVCGTWNFFET